jgi:nucleoside-diphosphate-sugar epimerase
LEDVSDRIVWVDCDLLDVLGLEDAMNGVQQVYHSAAIVSFNPADYKKMLAVNVKGSANVVNAALVSRVEKLVHVSSIAALGRSKNELHHDETIKWEESKLNSGYGISKHLAEMEIFRGIAEGLPAAIVNPSNILGSGFWRDRTSTGQFYYLTWKGMPFYAQGGNGFVDVRDVVRFMIKLMESPISGERYILNGENLTFKEVFSEIANVLGVKAPRFPINPVIREISWRVFWMISKLSGNPQIITRETARSSSRKYTYDNRKSLEVFNDFKYTPIRETIRETGKQFLEAVHEQFKPKVLGV